MIVHRIPTNLIHPLIDDLPKWHFMCRKRTRLKAATWNEIIITGQCFDCHGQLF